MQSLETVPGPVAYAVLTQLSEVEAVAADWEALLARSSCNRAFSSAAWYLAACRSNPEASPHVILARRGAGLAGILPLVKTRDGSRLTFSSRHADYNDVIAMPDDLGLAAGLLAHGLSQLRGDQKLALTDIRGDSLCARALPLIASAAIPGQLLQDHHLCPRVELASGFDAYLQTRSRSLQVELRRAKRNARRDDLRVDELEPTAFPASQLPDAFLSLHASRQPAGALAAAAAQAFVREALPTLFTERKLLAFAIHQGQRMIAINLCVLGVDSLGYWNGGFLADARRWSPGKLLIEAGIQRCCAMGLEEYDFLRGAEDYKQEWATDTRQTYRIELSGAARRSCG